MTSLVHIILPSVPDYSLPPHIYNWLMEFVGFPSNTYQMDEKHTWSLAGGSGYYGRDDFGNLVELYSIRFLEVRHAVMFKLVWGGK